MGTRQDHKARRELKDQTKLASLTEYHPGCVPSLMTIKKSTAIFVRPYIASYHYSRSLPDNSPHIFSCWYGHTLAAILIFGTSNSLATFSSVIPGIKKEECLELSRMWSPDGMPKNTESRAIALAIAKLPKTVKLLVSYADPSRGHLGIIYQATNWLYVGVTKKNSYLIDKDGFRKHHKMIQGYRKSNPAFKNSTVRQIKQHLGMREFRSAGKHKYIMLIGDKSENRTLRKQIKPALIDYPKVLIKEEEKEVI